MQSILLASSSLAPGDRRSAHFDWEGFRIARIQSVDDPLFPVAYSKLWNEFAPKGEMEQVDVISRRLQAGSWKTSAGPKLSYELIAVLKEEQVIAVRDHTAILQDSPSSDAAMYATVHMSHILIDPPHRGTGLSGWMRAWPVQLAQNEIHLAQNEIQNSHANPSVGVPLPEIPITLVAEMEYLDVTSPEKVARLRSYQKAGFQLIDPTRFRYLQPDFRSPEKIDEDGGIKPVPLQLVVRRVGREGESFIFGSELKQIVVALYTMFSTCFRKQDMKPLWDLVDDSIPSPNSKIDLLAPLEFRG